MSIVAGNRDRTTFPTTYARLDTDTLLDSYARGPERLRLAIKDIPDAGLRARPIRDKWSILEIVVHVADSELMGAARIRMVLADDGPRLPGYDQDRWSRDLEYQDADAARFYQSLDLFGHIRATTLPLLAATGPDDWARTGLHGEHGVVTLRNLLELYADHSERHIAQILERRDRLGTPIDLPLLLPERLY